jgi:hypothetical protein
LRAKKALDTRSTLLTIAIAILFLYMVPSAFGAQFPYYPIGLLVTSAYITLVAAAALVEARVARSRVATERIAASLVLISFFFAFTAVSPRVLPLEWFAPALLALLVSVFAGIILLGAGWHRAHKTIRQMAGESTAHRWGLGLGSFPAFEVRNYHVMLAAGVLGAFLLFLM